MMLFSGRSKEAIGDPSKWGIMLSYSATGRELSAIKSGALWFMDNGAFSGHFDPLNWRRRLLKFSAYASTCLGIILPDHVIFIDGKFAGGDWKKTLELAQIYAPFVRTLGLPVAYALQNNHDPELIPWHLFDTLFIGCADEYKFSGAVREIGLEAKRRGKWVHHGRVSGKKKINMVADYTDSIDTTAPVYGDDRAREIERWAGDSMIRSQPLLI